MTNIMENVKFVKEHVLWLDVFNIENPDLKEPVFLLPKDTKKDRSGYAEISYNFDYDPINDKGWHFYCYTTIRITQVATISIRTHFSTNHPTFSWDRFFSPDSLVPVITRSTEKAMLRFVRHCEKNGISLPPNCHKINTPENEIFTWFTANDFINFYQSIKSIKESAKEFYKICFDLPVLKAKDSRKLFPLVFSVLDDVLFNNRSFNRFHNRNSFFESMLEMDYYSLKFKSIDPQYPTYRLNYNDIINLRICLDCVIHMLENNKLDYFANIFKHLAISDEELIEYISFAKLLHEKCGGDSNLKSEIWDDKIRLIRDFN
jgi:hypothetical protein